MEKPKLNPTPTRLALLRDVKDGNVVYLPGVGIGVEGRSVVRGARRNVTGQMADFGYYGWAEKGLPESGPFSARPWLITDLGNQILAGAAEPAVAP